MSVLYFDTTYLGKLRWAEAGSAEVAACATVADKLVCALHGRAEFYSISHRKLREKLVNAADLQAVCAQFETECAADRIQFLPLTDAIVDRVTQVFAAADASVYLRAADALHLATAAEHGFTEIYSNDRHLLNAAPLFGLRGINVVS